MKRLNNLYNKIYDLDNLQAAAITASKGKRKKPAVIRFFANMVENLNNLRLQLLNKTFTTSTYSVFKIKDPKERLIHSLPFFPDLIVQHAIINVLEPLFLKWFTNDTYSCIRGRGVHLAANRLKKALLNKSETTYCLKLDITKFYQSVDNTILKEKLRKKIKDADLLHLLDNIINSAVGLPIGNFLSQYLSNFFLTEFDHWIKEVKKVKYYFRYADDMVFLSASKKYLHALLADIKIYLSAINLQVKNNYQVFPVAKRGIDFLGYVFNHGFTLLRKSIKQRYRQMLARAPNLQSIAAYYSWVKHCNSINLQRKFLKIA